MAPSSPAVAPHEWPVLSQENDWEVLPRSGAASGEDAKATWAARLSESAAAGADAAPKQINRSVPKLVEVTCNKKADDCELSTEDDEPLPSSKELAREARGRQKGSRSNHTLRHNRALKAVPKSSKVTAMDSNAAAAGGTITAAELSHALHQATLKEVAASVGGSCRQVKSTPGRQANVTGLRVFELTVPTAAEQAEEEAFCTFRVQEHALGRSCDKVRDGHQGERFRDRLWRQRNKTSHAQSQQTMQKQAHDTEVKEVVRMLRVA